MHLKYSDLILKNLSEKMGIVFLSKEYFTLLHVCFYEEINFPPKICNLSVNFPVVFHLLFKF